MLVGATFGYRGIFGKTLWLIRCGKLENYVFKQLLFVLKDFLVVGI